MQLIHTYILLKSIKSAKLFRHPLGLLCYTLRAFFIFRYWVSFNMNLCVCSSIHAWIWDRLSSQWDRHDNHRPLKTCPITRGSCQVSIHLMPLACLNSYLFYTEELKKFKEMCTLNASLVALQKSLCHIHKSKCDWCWECLHLWHYI